MNSDQIIAWTNSILIPNLPECEQLRSHVIKITSNLKLLEDKEYTDRLINGTHDEYIKIFFDFTDVFNNRLPEIFLEFGFGYPSIEPLREVNLLGLKYIGFSATKNYGLALTGMKKRLKNIDEAYQKLNKQLEPDIELLMILGSVSLTEIGRSIEVGEKFDVNVGFPKLLEKYAIGKVGKLMLELEVLENLELSFSESIMGRLLQYGRSGPKTNSALINWVEDMANIWRTSLDRELSFSQESFSGRENFLQFAEACFEQLHPSLTKTRPDAIRNAFEKLRSSGKFD